MWPDVYLTLRGQLFKFSRDFHPVSIRIVYHKKEVVAGAVSSRPPDNLDIQIGQVICPIPDKTPFSSFVGMMVQSLFIGFEKGKAMVFSIAV